MGRFVVTIVFACFFVCLTLSQKVAQQQQQVQSGQQQNRKTNTTTNATKTDDQYRQGQQAVITELNNRFRGYKENCYPLPKTRCRCVTRDESGNEKITVYENEEVSCKNPPSVATTPTTGGRRNG